DDLALGLRRVEHPAVDEHRAAGQRKRVDLFHVDGRERVFEFGTVELGRRDGYQPVSKLSEIRGDRLVLDDRVLLANLGGRFHAVLDVLSRREIVLWRLDDRLREQHALEAQRRGKRGNTNGSTHRTHGGRPLSATRRAAGERTYIVRKPQSGLRA